MGSITLCCGHELKRISWTMTMEEWDGKYVGEYCPKCYRGMKKWINFVEAERTDWNEISKMIGEKRRCG